MSRQPILLGGGLSWSLRTDVPIGYRWWLAHDGSGELVGSVAPIVWEGETLYQGQYAEKPGLEIFMGKAFRSEAEAKAWVEERLRRS